MEITIVSKITKPASVRTHSGRTPIYRFGDMKEEGDGFKVPFTSSKKEDRLQVIRRLSTAATSYARNHPGFFYETFTVDESNSAEELNAVAPAGPGRIIRRIDQPNRKQMRDVTAESAQATALAN